MLGIGSRFPGANDSVRFWQNLRDGIDSITEVLATRFDIGRRSDPRPGVADRSSSHWGGFIDGVEHFDAMFFGISRREALRMDPQQRLALEVAWDALDDGGLPPLSLRGTRTGVFIGVHRDEYSSLVERDPGDVDLIGHVGVSRSAIAGRISYALGLEGPSLVLDADRSSSLVAVLAACQSLRAGQCSLALAGGVNLVLTPEPSLAFSRANMLAPNGRIKFCDAAADGIVRSDGIGIVVLKHLDAALRDGDPIYALILGGAINHDGGRSGDLMTPSSASQAALLRAACDDAGVSPRAVQYVEAHGTGTIAGDPAEVAALAAVLQRGRTDEPALRIGSVKTNIGHCEAAGGIAGLIKVALAIKHRLLPASLHFTTPHPRIAFDGVAVQAETGRWPDETRRLVAGVTSLGLTGQNAHVILAEAPREAAAHVPAAPRTAEILTVSARGETAVRAVAGEYIQLLRGGATDLRSLATAAATRRSHFADRIAIVGDSAEHIARELEARLEGDLDLVTRRAPTLAFVFSEMDGAWRPDTSELLMSDGAFRVAMYRCDAAVRDQAGWSLLDDPARDPRAVLVALQLSLAAQWLEWGLSPEAVVGVGAGEIAAAHVAGVWSLEDAMRVAIGAEAMQRAQARLPIVTAREAVARGCDVLLELSPHPALQEKLAALAANAPPLLLGSLHAGEPERRAMLRAVAALYSRGIELAWTRIVGCHRGDFSLPAYPWQRDRFWFDASTDAKGARSQPEPLLATIPLEPFAEARELVTRALAGVLGLGSGDAIDSKRSFRELGLTSLLATELVAQLGRRTGRSLPASIVFNHPTVDALARHLVGTPSAVAPVQVARPDRGQPIGAEPIAVIGLGCRFPGANGPERFWQLLHDGVDAIREVPADRWDLARWYDPEPGQPGKMRTRWGGFVDEIAHFDAAFFGISPHEAEEMDPQQRLLLEVAWDALEHGAQAPDRLLGSQAGVFLGLMNNNDYVARKRLLDAPTRIRAHHSTGTAASVAAGRIAYLLGAKGPALAVDTACSSSLVAVQLAVQSLRRGECQLAIAGGVNAILSPELSVAFSLAGMLSPTGRCRTFDASADGYVRSEGCGVVVLKRLTDAVARGDRVLAVIRGAAINQDGRSNGLTAPNGDAQRAVVEAALADAGLAPADVDYVEAHGTGTRLGDPIEFQALGALFSPARSPDRPLWVGSVKTNIGHLEAAAGIAGLIKVILALNHREIPPHLHLRKQNPLLSAESFMLAIPTRAIDWRSDRERVAGVSSFGFSGTNAHVVLSEAPARAALPRDNAPTATLVVLSAKSEVALHALAQRHASQLALQPDLELRDIAFTLAEGRTHHEHRVAIVASTRGELLGSLRDVARGQRAARSVSSKVAPTTQLAWLFTGQGSQRIGMGKVLASEWPAFAAALDEACAALDPHLERPLRDVMWANPESADAALLDQTGFTQPALFATSVALAALWRSWGVQPDIVCGHSIGELAAAYVAGVFSLDDAARLVAARARLMQALPAGGAMVSIAAPEADVLTAIAPHADRVSTAAINGPSVTVISGNAAATLAIARAFSQRGVRVARLNVSHAFHSPLMEPMLAEFARVAETVTYRRPQIPGTGNIDGALWGPDVAIPDYWVRHVRAAVRFADCVTTLYRAGTRTFIELGPTPTLAALVRACIADEAIASLPTMRAERAETEVLLEALAGWYTRGGTVTWSKVLAPGRRVSLPTYAWQRQRFWIAPASGPSGLSRMTIANGDVVCETTLALDRQPWLADHRVAGDVVVPAAALLRWIGLALAPDACELRDVALRAPLRLPDAETRRLQIVVTRVDERRRHASVFSAGVDERWTGHVEAEIQHASASEGTFDLAAARARCGERVASDDLYDAFAAIGLSYGPAFALLRDVWRGTGELIARVDVPDTWANTELGSHPALLDAGLQAAIAGADALYLPFTCERVRMGEPVSEAWVSVTYATPPGASMLGANVTISDPTGRIVSSIAGLRAKRADVRANGRANVADAAYRLAFRCVDTSAGALPSGRWLVVGARLAAEIAAELAARGATCEHVGWAALRSAPRAEHVICVWDDGGDDDPPQSALARAWQALEVANALAAQAPAPRVWWMTHAAVAVTGAEKPALAEAALWGLGRSVMHEYPELGLTLVDLPHVAALDAALGELAIRDGETEVVWREGGRHAARLEHAPLGRDSARLRGDGTVLVTGGLGGIGQHVARWLAARGTRHLVLAGRRGERTPGAVELAGELERLGTRITLATADVTVRESLASLLAAIPSDLPLRAIVHAAGSVDDGVLAEQNRARFASVMAAKTMGAWHLDQLTRDRELDAFILFSSVAGAFGSPGQAAYAAANAFLDALAVDRRARGLPANSLAWGPWEGTGMAAVLDAQQRGRWEARCIGSLSPARAVALCEAALGHADAQLLIAPLDLARARTAFAPDVPSPWRSFVRASAASTTRGTWREQLQAAPTAKRESLALELVRGEVARLLSLAGPDAVGIDVPLATLGLDSLMSLELRNTLGQRVGTRLPTTLAFDYPTPVAVARYLLESLGEPAVKPAPIGASAASRADEPIAIIGYGCRFPGGANDPDSFWRLLADGVDAIREVPTERWDIDAYYDPDPNAPGKMYTRAGGFLDGLDLFEPEFFGISPREAVHMDPQQRLLLETSWEALERAAIAPASLLGANVGVFVGVMSHEYLELQGLELERRDGYVTTGSLGAVASGRISYALGVQGPSMTIDTACSSSLVATHLACQALRAGECELALAGGATVVLTPALFVEFSRLRALSRDGRCKSFSAAADGVIWSEGCGVIALKRLRDAERDGDRILALIAGSAVNQDGRSQGLTAPNGLAQQDVIRRALAQAKLAPADVDYVEAHGTGTRLGDPIEMQALGVALGPGRERARPVIVGSLKSNLGHAQAAAGVGGIIKTVLALEHSLIPKSLHFDAPSPHIPWSELPVRVAGTSVAWRARADRPRVAGISSFGISGTNAHVVLREAPARSRESKSARTAALMVVSAKSEPALTQAASRLATHLRAHPELQLGDVAATLALGRTHHPHRVAVVARSLDEAAAELAAAQGGIAASPGKVAWLFTGQGSQVAGMGRGLAAEWPVFASELERVCTAFDPYLERPLRQVMWGEGATAQLLDQTGFTQPALFALEVALAALWRSWGVQLDLLLGHSIGELAAAHVAGVFSLDDAARLVAARARLMQALPAGGAMVSIAASEAIVAEAVAPHADQVSIAAVNGPSSVVISGASGVVEAIAAAFESRRVRTWRLAVSHAFHSPLLDPMLEDFSRVARSLEYRRPSCALISNLSGTFAGDEFTTPEYWVQHARGAVRFAAGVAAVHAAGARVFVELGPKPTLLGLVPGCLPGTTPTVLGSLRPERETEAALDALGALHARGFAVEWRGVFQGTHARVDLPTYPWQRKTYWVKPSTLTRDAAAAGMTALEHPWLIAAIERPDGEEHMFSARVSTSDAPWLADHRIFGAAMLPGTAFLELALSAAQRVGATRIARLTLAAPLSLPERAALPMQIWVRSAGAERELSLYARAGSDGPWTCHARGVLVTAPAMAAAPARWPPAHAEPVDVSAVYDRLAELGLCYRGAFRGLTALWRDCDDLYARVELAEPLRHQPFLLHPALLDASLHALPFVFDKPGGALLPFEWRDVELAASGAASLIVRLSVDASAGEPTKIALEGRDAAGELVIRVGELVVRRVASLRVPPPMYRVGWEPLAASGRDELDTVVLGADADLARRLELPHIATFDALLADPPARVVVDAAAHTPADLVRSAHRATHAALAVLQAWLREPGLARRELVWVTQGAIAATERDELAGLEHAAVWGLVRSARHERTDAKLRLLDIDATTTPAQFRAALALQEEPEIALRGAELLVPRLASAGSASHREPWRTDGTVLVTGASGALGAEIARHLVAAHGVRRLLLISRRGLEAAGARELRDELVARGARVTFAACDASDRQALTRVLASVHADAPLAAVFHCAGSLDDCALSALSEERIDRVFAAKVDAAVRLHELTCALPLSAFVLFSSVAGVLGTAGQANYAAANAFLDALAAQRARAGLAGQSLAWGLWQPASSGMTAKLSAADLARIRRQGIAPLSVAEGLALLDDALERGEPALVPAKLDLREQRVPIAMLRKLVEAAPVRAAAAERPRAHETATWAERLVKLAPAERQTALFDLVRAEAAGVLRLPSHVVADAEPFKSVGLDSLMALELGDRLAAKLQLQLPATLAFDHPTVAQVVQFVATLLPAERRKAPRKAATNAGRAIEGLSDDELVTLMKSL